MVIYAEVCALPVGSIVGGYKILALAPSFNGMQRRKVECQGCKCTCVRDVAAFMNNSNGCKKCLMRKRRTERSLRAHGKAPKLVRGDRYVEPTIDLSMAAIMKGLEGVE